MICAEGVLLVGCCSPYGELIKLLEFQSNQTEIASSILYGHLEIEKSIFPQLHIILSTKLITGRIPFNCIRQLVVLINFLNFSVELIEIIEANMLPTIAILVFSSGPI